METKHTPGPWRWVATPENDPAESCAMELVRDPYAPGDADSICYHGADWPMSDANARLIAAAPELLAALREALPELEAAAVAETRRNKAPTGQPPSHAKRERWERARAAIARARP